MVAAPTTTIDMNAETGDDIPIEERSPDEVLSVFGTRIAADVPAWNPAFDITPASLIDVIVTERGIAVCLETHDSWRDPKDVAGVLARVNHPAIAANWDVIHPIRAKYATVDESFEALKPWIKHLHIHDGDTITGELKMMAMGTGGVDHKRIIELLKTIDYDGHLSGEWIKWEPYEVHLPREIDTLRQYEVELG